MVVLKDDECVIVFDKKDADINIINTEKVEKELKMLMSSIK